MALLSANVSHQDADDTIPEPPGAEVTQGVLPRLIATLVQRRRQVKSLMKDRTIAHAKHLQVWMRISQR